MQKFIAVIKQVEKCRRIAEAICVGCIPHGILNHCDILRSVKQRDGIRFLLDGELRSEAEIGLTRLALLGRDKKYTIGARCTVDSGRGGIFEHLDTFDVGRRDVEECAEVIFVGVREVKVIAETCRGRNTIDDDKRVGVG